MTFDAKITRDFKKSLEKKYITPALYDIAILLHPENWSPVDSFAMFFL